MISMPVTSYSREHDDFMIESESIDAMPNMIFLISYTIFVSALRT